MSSYSSVIQQVKDGYMKILGREADKDGLRSYTTYLKRNTTAQFLRALFDSDEFKTSISPKRFTLTGYRYFNDDIADMTDEELIEHYCAHGYKENRKCAMTFHNTLTMKQVTTACYINFDVAKYVQNCSIGDADILMEPVQSAPSVYALISHSDIGGAPRVVIEIFKYLKQRNKQVKMFFPFPCKLLNEYNKDTIYYQEDQTLLYMLLRHFSPKVILANSWNPAYKCLANFKNDSTIVWYSHEFKQHYNNSILHQTKDSKLYTVCQYISNQYPTSITTKVCPPFYSSWQLVMQSSRQTDSMTRALSAITKPIVTMSGHTSDVRKNFEYFKKVAHVNQKYHFLWIGGKETAELSSNLIVIGHTTNPFMYMNTADYFLLTSTLDPCPYVVLESMYLGLHVMVFKDNIGYKHNHETVHVIDRLIHDKIYTLPVLIKRSKSAAPSARKYVVDNFSSPQIPELH